MAATPPMSERAAALLGASGPIRGLAGRLTRDEPLPGGVIVVANRTGSLGEVRFGLTDIERGREVDADDVFEIGSISKFLVSIAMARLVDAGRLRLSDPVTAHLPWWQAGPHTAQITVRHLLNHTAGLVAGVEGIVDEPAQAWALRDRATFEPGARFHYSNIGYVTLGLVIEAVTGRRLADVLYHGILEPMGAQASLGAIVNADRRRLATGYAPAADDRPWLPGDPLAPATWLEALAGDGCVAMDAAGVGALLRLLLGDGAVDGRRIVSASGMTTIRTTLAPGGEDVVDGTGGFAVTSSRYGLGINVETIDGRECLTHGGGMVGYASFVLADPGADVAVAVLTNADGDCLAAHLLARYVHRLLLDPTAADEPAPVTDRTERAARADLTGDIAGTDDAGLEVPVRLDRDPASGLVTCSAAGRTGRVFQDLYGRLSTDHPTLRGCHLHRVTTARGGAGGVGPSLTGHYRSHNPWFTNFRIVDRGGRLFMTTTGGVEALIDDEELVPLGAGVYRVGAEEWRPERIRVLVEVGGRAILIDRDGCRYSAAI